MIKLTLIVFLLTAIYGNVCAQEVVTFKASPGSFPIVSIHQATSIYVAETDHWLVQKAAALLQQDIERVTGQTPAILHTIPNDGQNIIIIGSLDKSHIIKNLVSHHLLKTDPIAGKWEGGTTQLVELGNRHALVIMGNDKRGTAYGVFELSRQIGVSPWYWWADVPVKQHQALYMPAGFIKQDAPLVKYRGFFINDEAPALSGWTKEKFGGFNHQFYEKVFELLLRLKANYLWPAMWGNAFNTDDTLNPVLADKYGIVMGTSHHEPMLRSQQEWKRFGSGPWNYTTNADTLQQFWKQGIIHMDARESIVTIGMRGDGDMPMTEGSNISLLEKIVRDQRGIIQQVTGKDPAATPQSWALYKEVQEYYDKGMRVPDDVTLLLCDDNWGNLRKLPHPGDKPRSGGYGIYYHFDYVGDPRNYKWLNTNQVSRVWQQMRQAWQYGVNNIWIVNVGDIKPMEFPISFFLDYAWNPCRIDADSLEGYTRAWAKQQFGPEQSGSIARILDRYTLYNARRKPELLSPDTYSLLHYSEAEKITAAYKELAAEADSIYQRLPAQYRDAYYQLVLFPVLACSNLNELYTTVGLNHLYASQGRTSANDMADKAQSLFSRDSILTHYYNKEMLQGKWDHMMDQTHIGYTYWQQPSVNTMPAVKRVGPAVLSSSPSTSSNVSTSSDPSTSSERISPSYAAGISIEGSSSWWPEDSTVPTLPTFYSYDPQPHYLEIFNRSIGPIKYAIHTDQTWLKISSQKGSTDRQERIWFSIDPKQAPKGSTRVPVRINLTGPESNKEEIKKPITVMIILENPDLLSLKGWHGFMETNGFVSMEAVHYARAETSSGTQTIKWQVIPGLGRTGSAIQAQTISLNPSEQHPGSQTGPTSPQAPPPILSILQPGAHTPHLEYDLYFADTGMIRVDAYCSPLLAFNGKLIRFGISFDNEPPQLIDATTGNDKAEAWQKMVADDILILPSIHHITKPGKHILKYWLMDDGVVLQKLVADRGGAQACYLGPPESLQWPPLLR